MLVQTPVARPARRLGRLAAGPRDAADAQCRWLLVWRLVAVGQAFLDTGRTGPTGRLGDRRDRDHRDPRRRARTWSSTATARPSATHSARSSAGDVLGATDDSGAAAGPAPRDGERINVLLVGVDKRGKRTANLTDTMMVASLDPVGHTVSLVSIPRDLIDTPLGERRRLRTEAQLADGLCRTPTRRSSRTAACATLEDAVGALLGDPDPLLRPARFRRLHQDGRCRRGVDIVAPRGFDDPSYDGYGVGETWLLDHRRPTPFRRRATPLPTQDLARLSARATSPGRLASSRSSSRCEVRRRAAGACSSSCRTCSTPSARPSARTSRSIGCRPSPRSWRTSAATT